METFTATLLEMGYSRYDIERAYVAGYTTIESAIEFISGELCQRNSDCNEESTNRLRLCPPAEPRTAFTCNPVYVNLSDALSEPPIMDPVPEQFDQTGEKPVESRFNASAAEEQFQFEQREARRIAEALRHEKLMRRQEAERIRAQINAEKQAKLQARLTQNLPPDISTTSASTATGTVSQPTTELGNSMMKLKVVLCGRVASPSILNLTTTASYRDLLDALQPLLTANPPECDATIRSANILPSSDSTLQALLEHMRTVSVTDSCIRLIAPTWPRQELRHCSTMTTDDLVGQQLADLNICNGTTVNVVHANCVFEAQVSAQVAQLNALVPSAESERIAIDPASVNAAAAAEQENRQREGEDDDQVMAPAFPILDQIPMFNVDEPQRPRFPGLGYQLRPQPPGGVLPASSLSVQDTTRRAALELEQRLRTVPPSQPLANSVSESPAGSWLQVERLVTICLRTVLTWIRDYAESVDAARLGLLGGAAGSRAVGRPRILPTSNRTQDSPASDQKQQLVELWVLLRLSGAQWPELLGQQLVAELLRENCFNPRTALLVRNCVSKLDLSYYALITNELVTCLAGRWSGLHELRLDSVDRTQIAPETLIELKRLQNLTVLSLNGLRTVCDQNLPHLLELRNLEVLRLSETQITDDAWIAVAQSSRARSEQQSGRSSFPLIQLELAKMGSCLTDRGVHAIAQLFPNLRFLNVAQSHIVGDCTPVEGGQPLRYLKILDVTGCPFLRRLPSVLLPPAEGSSGLGVLQIGQCEQLDLDTLLQDLQGHPVTRIDGFETMPSLNSTLLKRIFSSGFPLTRVALMRCNFDWLSSNPALFAELLSLLPVNTLRYLSLPMRPVQYPRAGDPAAENNRNLICSALCELEKCQFLTELDLGSQIVGQPEFQAIVSALPKMQHLERVTVTNLPRGMEKALENACPSKCKIHIRNHL